VKPDASSPVATATDAPQNHTGKPVKTPPKKKTPKKKKGDSTGKSDSTRQDPAKQD
jgi:hypothetical protein